MHRWCTPKYAHRRASRPLGSVGTYLKRFYRRWQTRPGPTPHPKRPRTSERVPTRPHRSTEPTLTLRDISRYNTYKVALFLALRSTVCLLSINQQAFLRCGRIGRSPRRVKTCVGRSSSRKSSTSSRHSFGECRYQGCWVEWHGCMRAVVPLPVRGRRKRMQRQSRSVGLITSFLMHGYLRGLQNGWRFADSSMANTPSTQRC